MATHRSMRRFRWRAVAALSAFVLVAAAACGDDDDDVDVTDDDDVVDDGPLAQYQEDGIVIGIANEVPYGYEDDGEATGEAPELAKEIFPRLDIEVTDFVVTDFDGLIPGLTAGRYDVVAAGMFINPERAESALFSNPDYCGTTAFAVPEGNPDNLTDFPSVADSDAVLGVLSGAVEVGYAEDNGVPGDQLETLPEVADLFDALEAGRVDAVALTSVTVREQTEALDGFEASDPFVPVVDGEEQLGCGAFAFRFEDQGLRDAFNEELAAMQEAGEVLPIIEPFGFSQEDVDLAADITANELAEGAYDDLGDPPAGGGDADDMDEDDES
jgi:polar amino acid transport system substrate-binding protein